MKSGSLKERYVAVIQELSIYISLSTVGPFSVLDFS